MGESFIKPSRPCPKPPAQAVDLEAKKLKMYIVVKNTLTPAQVAIATAHASLACYLQYDGHLLMNRWRRHSFAKIVLGASPEQFAMIKHWSKRVIMTESTLDHEEVSIAFLPQIDEARFKDLKLWKST